MWHDPPVVLPYQQPCTACTRTTHLSHLSLARCAGLPLLAAAAQAVCRHRPRLLVCGVGPVIGAGPGGHVQGGCHPLPLALVATASNLPNCFFAAGLALRPRRHPAAPNRWWECQASQRGLHGAHYQGGEGGSLSLSQQMSTWRNERALLWVGGAVGWHLGKAWTHNTRTD